MKPDFTAGEASRLAGFKKPWMLGHLEREGIFVRDNSTDRRHGQARKYTFNDIVILRAINRMLDLGARPARIKKVISELGAISGLPGSYRAALKMVQKVGVCLFVTKDEAFLVTTNQEIVDLTKRGQLAFSFMIDIEKSLEPVVRTMQSYKKERVNNWKQDKSTLDRLCKVTGL